MLLIREPLAKTSSLVLSRASLAGGSASEPYMIRTRCSASTASSPDWLKISSRRLPQKSAR